jgi:hypothetical protein
MFAMIKPDFLLRVFRRDIQGIALRRVHPVGFELSALTWSEPSKYAILGL